MAKHDDDEKGEPASGAAIVALLERVTRLVRAAEHGGDLNPAQWEALRYLSRANRFSNSPTALTHYLGATKGTISQTVKSLVRKGYLEKIVRPEERRSVALNVTEKGRAVLTGNSWIKLEDAAGELGGKTRRRLERGLRGLLDDALSRGDHRPFGSCASCRHLGAAMRCTAFNENMTQSEMTLLCVAFLHQED